MDATNTTPATPTLALAYFRGYSAAEACVAVGILCSTQREIVESFAEAVARRTVAREAYAAWQSGWRNAEALLS